MALLIGAAAALHRLDDTLVWTLLQRLDRVRVRAFDRLLGVDKRAVPPARRSDPRSVHPAVEMFLLRNQTSAGCTCNEPLVQCKGKKEGFYVR
jgi:hypothetical protein